MFYSYSNQVAVEAILDGRGRVVKVEDYRRQPAATGSEIHQAVALARRSLRQQDGWSDDLASGVIAITNDDPTSPDYGRRLMDVRFFTADERLAKLMAIVDLGKGKITRSGSVQYDGEQPWAKVVLLFGRAVVPRFGNFPMYSVILHNPRELPFMARNTKADKCFTKRVSPHYVFNTTSLLAGVLVGHIRTRSTMIMRTFNLLQAAEFFLQAVVADAV